MECIGEWSQLSIVEVEKELVDKKKKIINFRKAKKDKKLFYRSIFFLFLKKENRGESI